ncbi:MAG: AsmA-like C-terminal domain-containing protein [Thermodesulfobacteriota bacterium]|nr:AsmA-like C-terminal domain-containing protein [Thermodesulfobacteriota bacterium]
MSHHSKKFLLWILIPVVVVGILLFWTIHYLFDPNLYRNALQKSLTFHLGREVTFGKAKIGFWGGIGIAFEDFRIKDRSQSFDLFQSNRLILTAKILPLLRREVKWKRITLEKPKAHLFRDRNGRFNFSGAPLTGEELKSSRQKMIQILSTLFGGSLSIRSGEISFSDESIDGSPLSTEIRSFDLRISKASFRKSFPFHMSGKILHSKKEGRFSISGTIEDINEEMDIAKGRVKAEGEVKNLEVFHFWPYFKTLLPMNKIAGTLDLKGRYQGDLSGPFKASVRIQFRDVAYDHPKVFAYLFTPKWLNLDLHADYDRSTFKISQFSIELPEIKIKGKGRIYGIGTKEMGLDAEASSGSFDLSDGRRFIPFRIITPSVSDALFRAEGSGPVQILSVRLSGKIPEIEHCDQLQYAHTLMVEMRINGTRLKLPWNLPALEGLKGHLLFKGGHLNLKEVEGRVFHSSIDRAHGIFYELLQVPTLEIHSEGRLDLSDLPSLVNPVRNSSGALNPAGINLKCNPAAEQRGIISNGVKTDAFDRDSEEALAPISSLSGRAQYQISLNGKLKAPLHFKHQGGYLLSRVHLTHSQIPFPIQIDEGKLNLSNDDLQWSGAKVEFGNSSFLMGGSWKTGGAFEITAKGKADLKTLLALSQSPLLPEETRSKAEEIKSLSGTGQLSFKGRRATLHQPFFYELEFAPKEVSLLLKGASDPLLFREGSLFLSNLGTAFSKLKIQSLNSSLSFDGTVKQGELNLLTSGSIDLKNIHAMLQLPLFPDSMRTPADEIQNLAGSAELRLNWSGRAEDGVRAIREGEIRLKGVSLRHPKIPAPLSQIEGRILFSPQQIRCDGLKGKLGDSSLTLTSVSTRLASPAKAGTIKADSGVTRRLSFQFSSSHLDLDSLFPEREKKTPTSFEMLRKWLSSWAIEGKVDIEQAKYRNLHCQDLKFEMKMVDGKLLIHPFQLKANGGDLWGEGWIEPAGKGIRFEIKPRLSNMEAVSFLRTLLPKGEEEKIWVTGRIYIDKVELRGEGEDFQRVKESLKGGLRLELENGVIERGNILAKIFSILNVSQLFKGRLPDLKTKGLPYHRISSNIEVKEGVASTGDFLVDSDAMRITIIGKIDLGKHLIDAKIGVHPLGTVDMVLSHIPIAGYILTGKEKAFLSYVYEVKGDLDDPKIEAIPFKSIGEGLLGIFKRLLETPLRPFQKNDSPKK